MPEPYVFSVFQHLHLAFVDCVNMSLEDVENIKKRIENFKKTLIELTESPNINGTVEQYKIREMSAEVVDSNPYR